MDRYLPYLVAGRDGSLQRPFFKQEALQSPFEGRKPPEGQTLDLPPLPESLDAFYRASDGAVEWYLNDLTILSANAVCKQYNLLKERGQTRVVDFAYTYAGMGHVNVYFYDPLTDTIKIRLDGGSNGHERAHNFRGLLEHVPDGVADTTLEELLLEFSRWSRDK